MTQRQFTFAKIFFLIAVALDITSLPGRAAAAESPEEKNTRPVTPLPRAHAHNDYHHERPLLDALEHGFCSVEADVFLVDGQLQVAHSRDELKSKRTLARLYLDPLQQRVASNGGRVYRDGPVFILMIDIKSSGTETYHAIDRELKKYRTMLTRVEEGHVVDGAIQVIVSGNRDVEAIAADNPRYVGIDGRLSDLDSDLPAHLMPMISDNWQSHFRWRGRGEFNAAEKTKLRDVITTAHNAGRRVRFWATPESPAIWAELHAAGADALNTDQLAQLQTFLLEQTKK